MAQCLARPAASGCDAAGALRVQIASDLHLEFYDVLPRFHDMLIPEAPVLALLGDICSLGHPRGQQLYEKFVRECEKHFDVVLLVVGNHEFYSDNVSRYTETDVFTYLRKFCASCQKVRLLENEAVTLGGVRIFGSALWSAIPDSQTVAGARAAGEDVNSVVEKAMNDYHLIFVRDSLERGEAPAAPVAGGAPPKRGEKGRGCLGGLPIPSVREPKSLLSLGDGIRKLRVSDSNSWHEKALRTLEQQAALATRDNVNLLVLTHHTPSMTGTSDPRHDGSNLGSAFSTDLSHILKDPTYAAIHTWCFGHTHYNSDQKNSAGVRLVSNQRGYAERLSPGYSRRKVIDVPLKYQGLDRMNASARHHASGNDGRRREEEVKTWCCRLMSV
eukprot:TRINITY_DN29422_c0_g1_i1.p1 TRINITY_DN29422_c0_g1~~TRINITY_DN29422_c0_g1_i1.p1  ORF type:complete len:386 (+),score=62.64 TRINITY_DN29422_c0_g1_i1:77-1234(+)